jgi:hypothetical protein
VRLNLGTVLSGTILLISVGVLSAQSASESVPSSPVIEPVSASGGGTAAGEQPTPGQATPTNPLDQVPPGGKRVFGVLPNYRTASSDMEGGTLTAKQKMTIAAKDSFDYPLVILAGMFAGLDQLTNSDPSFGQGMKGYAHRLGAWYLDESIGNMMTEGIFPAMLHQDPRYFRKGSGGFKRRTGYALSRVIITDKDGGGKQFDYSEWLGNATAVAISQTYHPDNRTAADATELLLEQVGTDAISQVLKEFWPDIKRKLFTRKHPVTASLDLAK